MAKAFPTDNPFLSGYYAPLHTEADAVDLPISGEIPRELCGSLYRIGPNPQFAPRGRYHWFSGDGMVHAFDLLDGRVNYRNRWVRTPKWQLEREVGEGLSGGLTHRHLTDPRLLEMNSTVANTNIVWHADRLLALEEAHAPYAMDPGSLESLGYHDFGGRHEGPMTAHPKIDPVSGEMIFFGYAAAGPLTPDLRVSFVDRSGRLTRSIHLQAPFPSMVHDFIVTQTHVILPIFPLTGSMERARAGRPAYAWEAEFGSHIGVLPRSGRAEDIRWLSGDACYVFHPMNAYDSTDGRIVCDMMKYDVAPLFPLPDGSRPTEQTPTARLVRWTLDPVAGRYTETAVHDQIGEFPRLDERFTALPYRHGYFNAAPVTAAIGRNQGSGHRDDDQQGDGADKRAGLAHIDLHSGRLSRWLPPIGDFCGEPVFVPRGPGASEGDGWLLSVIWRGEENRSDLAVFEAGDIAAGPIGLAHLSHRVPAGFHGNWRAA